MDIEITIYGLPADKIEYVRDFFNQEDSDRVTCSDVWPDCSIFSVYDALDWEAVYATADRLADDLKLLMDVSDNETVGRTYYGPGAEERNFQGAVTTAIYALDALAEFDNVEERTGFWDIKPIIELLEKLKYGL